MDIQSLLCQTDISKDSSFHLENELYDKQLFDYCPSSPSAWSSVSSRTFMSEPTVISAIHSPTSREREDSSEFASILNSNLSVHTSSSVNSSPTVSASNSDNHSIKSSSRKQQTRTPWTVSEDYLLEKGYMQGLSWAMISAKYLPHRSRGCCWGRFKTLQTKSTERKNWTESEDRVLLGAIKKNTKLFKQAWRSVAMDLNDRDWRECEIRSARISSLMTQKRQSLN